LRLFLDLTWGVPSQDTFLRVLAAINAQAFRFAFISWVRATFPRAVQAGQIAIDGKTARRSGDAKAEKAAVHMVSALACSFDLVLAQHPTEQKSNELTAIRTLLGLLELHGALVSIDAIGCQTDVAERVVDGGGDYLLAVKKNQPELHRTLEEAFEASGQKPNHNVDQADPPEFERHEENDGGHGRIEKRTTTVISATDPWIPKHIRDRWSGLATCIEVRSERDTGTRRSEERRYYISSRKLSAKDAGLAVRSHWRVENNLHYVLDVSFGEDACTVRKDNAAANFIVLRHFAVSLIRAYQGDKYSVPRRRRQCDYNTDYREQLLAAVAM
jgi:predicted transposase YbfD/YdcC